LPAQDQGDQSHDEFQVFALELEEINPLDTVKITSERLAQLQKVTKQDPVMQTLKSTILMGWPDTREQVPISIRDYWNFHEDLTLHNGILLKSQHVIIPRALRPKVISRLHSSHLGIEACLRKARDRVYWPAMNSDIKEAVTKCQVCAEFQASNPQQPLQKLSDRSYLVETSGGEVLCRNRHAIKPSQSEHVAEQDSPKAESAVPQTSMLSASTDLAASTTAPAARTSSRTIKKPVRFQDYVC